MVLYFNYRYVPYCDVHNDLWGVSHFNFEVEKDINYHVLRTGAFPFIKFHCSRRPWEDLKTENTLYCCLKIINLGKNLTNERVKIKLGIQVYKCTSVLEL